MSNSQVGIFGGLAVIGIVAVGATYLMPTAASACFNYQKTILKDPYYARLDSSSMEKDGTVVIRYHAKNSYGAYVPGEAVCVVSGTEVSKDATELRRGNRQLEANIKRLDREIACLAERNNLLSRGKSLEDAKKEVGDCEYPN